MWRFLAWLVTRPRVRLWIVTRAERTPYTHITSADGKDVYMRRFWLFNPYPAPGSYEKRGVWNWLPSIRVHHILRPDHDRDRHNHPWDARTFVLAGAYSEDRTTGVYLRGEGYTGVIPHDAYHKITGVTGPGGGVVTLFVTYRKRHSWGFMVDGAHVPYREYLGID